MKGKHCIVNSGVLLMIFILVCGFSKTKQGSKHLDFDLTSNEANTPAIPGEFSFSQSDTTVALLKNDTVIWQFNFNPKYDKPYFFPLRTSIRLNELAALRPADHLWHRGLWFSWKMINKVNYWEENDSTHLSDGRSIIRNVKVKLKKNFSATIYIDMAYGPKEGTNLLNESRMISISAPDASGNYFIDWQLKFKAKKEWLVFDRTPPLKYGGPYYGGYAGLSIRASEKMTDPVFKDSEGWENKGELIGNGKPAHWMDLSGVVDSVSGSKGGVAIFSHPSNNHSPAPWYIYKDKQFAFINPALLFDKQIQLQPGEKMTLLYRVMIHENELSNNAIDQENEKFKKIFPLK